jgi:hypothetical protein
MAEKVSMFFFEKENPKTFGCSRPSSGQTVATQRSEESGVFLVTFFAKKVTACFAFCGAKDGWLRCARNDGGGLP